MSVGKEQIFTVKFYYSFCGISLFWVLLIQVPVGQSSENPSKEGFLTS